MRINRKRQDLVSFEKVENIQTKLKLKAQAVADLMGISRNHYYICRMEGHVPIFRFQSLINALRLAIIEEQQDKLKLLDTIINSSDDD